MFNSNMFGSPVDYEAHDAEFEEMEELKKILAGEAYFGEEYKKTFIQDAVQKWESFFGFNQGDAFKMAHMDWIKFLVDAYNPLG